MTIFEHKSEEIEKAIKEFDMNRFYPEDISEDAMCIAIDCMRAVLYSRRRTENDT